LTNHTDFFNLNALDLDTLEACLRERLPRPIDPFRGQSVSPQAGDDRRQTELPIIYLNASKITPTFPPDHALDTFTQSPDAAVFLAAPFCVEIRLAAGANKVSLLSISYLETVCTSYISIRNSTQHFFLEVSSECAKPAKRFVLIPHGSVSLCSNDPVIIETCLLPPPGAEQIQGVGRFLMRAPTQLNRTEQADGILGLFGLTFDADVSQISALARPRPSLHVSPYRPCNSSPTLKEIRLFPMGMWPGYDVSGHGCFQGLPGLKVLQADSINDADAILVGVFSEWHDLDRHYQHIISLTTKPLVFYTNEHSSEGVLPGIHQLDFGKYFACLSHYRVSHSSHVWSPMVVNWFGWQCLDQATDYFRQSLRKFPHRARLRKAIFCYSNDCCEYRNRTAELLLSADLLHACGRLLNNCEGKTAPRDRASYLDYCSRFSSYIAFENSSFPGYFTEKAMQGIMAGCKTFYWGDATVEDLFSERWCVNLTGLSVSDSALVIAGHLVDNDEGASPKEPFKPLFRDLLMASRDSLCRILLSLT
jgi:hypothetical protein